MIRRAGQSVARRGMTMLEVLVTIGVMSLLMALFAPAVQSSRESSRRIDCANRLKQIVLGTEAFAATHQHYPKYASFWNACPLVEILPYVDRSNVYGAIDHEQWFGSFDAYTGNQLFSPQNAEFVKLTIPLYQCPSDRSLGGSCNYRVNLGTGADWYTHPPAPPLDWCFDPNNGNGAFQSTKTLAPADFTDGLSNTAMYGERVIGDGDVTAFDPWRDYSQVVDPWPHCTGEELRATCQGIAGIAPNHASFAGHTWVYASKAHTSYDHVLGPNSGVPDCARDGTTTPAASNSAIAARSQHPGMVNAAFGDGSVRPVSENINELVWRSLGSRNGSD